VAEAAAALARADDAAARTESKSKRGRSSVLLVATEEARRAAEEVGAALRAIHKSQNAVDGAVGQVHNRPALVLCVYAHIKRLPTHTHTHTHTQGLAKENTGRRCVLYTNRKMRFDGAVGQVRGIIVCKAHIWPGCTHPKRGGRGGAACYTQIAKCGRWGRGTGT